MTRAGQIFQILGKGASMLHLLYHLYIGKTWPSFMKGENSVLQLVAAATFKDMFDYFIPWF